MANSKLENQFGLGLHLVAGVADGFLTSASEVKDEVKNQSVQESLDALFKAVGGSVKGAVASISAGETPNHIKVTYANGDTEEISTVEVLNVLNSESTTSALSAAQGKALKDSIDSEASARDEAITNAINALNVSDAEVAGEFVYVVSETNGKIAISRKKVDASVVTFSSTKVTGAADVKTAIEKVHDTATASKTSSVVTLAAADTATEGYLKTYELKQGGVKVGTIDIPKDLVVTSGSVVKGNWDNSKFTESASGTGTALKLVIANQDAPVYINTRDLVKDLTAGNGITVGGTDATNEVSIKLADDSETFLKVGATGLKLEGVQTAIDNAVKTAKDTVDAYTVNGKRLSTNPTLAAADIQKADGTTVENALADLASADSQIRSDYAAADATTLASAKEYVDGKVGDLTKSGIIHQHVATATTGTSLSVLATAHDCGKHPIVKTYLAGAEVDCNVSVDFSSGNVVVSWNGSAVTASSPLTVVVMGNPGK